MPSAASSRRDVNGAARFLGASTVLFGAIVPVGAVIDHHYGIAAGRRFKLGMSAAIGAQQALVGVALRKGEGAARSHVRHHVKLVDCMTLSRGWGAALIVGVLVSGVRDRRGASGWMAWISLLYGAILCDWLDGPIARHGGTSEIGAVMDLEADSWLTLCTAGAAVRWGDLPLGAAVAPLLRYVLLFDTMRRAPNCAFSTLEPRWVRPLGILQMFHFIAALAPFNGRITSRLVRSITLVQTPLQLGGMAALYWRIRRAQ